MKIARLVMREVRVPLLPERVASPEFGPVLFDQPPKWIVEARTKEGVRDDARSATRQDRNSKWLDTQAARNSL